MASRGQGASSQVQLVSKEEFSRRYQPLQLSHQVEAVGEIRASAEYEAHFDLTATGAAAAEATYKVLRELEEKAASLGATVVKVTEDSREQCIVRIGGVAYKVLPPLPQVLSERKFRSSDPENLEFLGPLEATISYEQSFVGGEMDALYATLQNRDFAIQEAETALRKRAREMRASFVTIGPNHGKTIADRSSNKIQLELLAYRARE